MLMRLMPSPLALVKWQVAFGAFCLAIDFLLGASEYSDYPPVKRVNPSLGQRASYGKIPQTCQHRVW